MMSLCTSHSLFPPLSVSEVFALSNEKRGGYFKVQGYLRPSGSKKRDRAAYGESECSEEVGSSIV